MGFLSSLFGGDSGNQDRPTIDHSNNKNYQILDNITGTCTPSRKNTITGKNYPYRSAEPSVLINTETGVDGTGEFFPTPVELPGYRWEVPTLVQK